MSFSLRPYQREAIKEITKQFGQSDRVCFQLPTGGGKAIILAKLISLLVKASGRVLVLAQRVELISQVKQKIEQICDRAIKAGYEPGWAMHRIREQGRNFRGAA